MIKNVNFIKHQNAKMHKMELRFAIKNEGVDFRP